MRKKQRHAGNINLVGGRLCLDFVNTVDGRGTPHPIDFLHSYQELVRWSRHVEILTEQDLQFLLCSAEKHPGEAERVCRQAVTLREVLYGVFVSLIHSTAPREEDLEILNLNLSHLMSQARIILVDTKFVMDVHGQKDTLEWLLKPIIWSAVELLVSDDVKKVKMCSDSTCNWLFWDSSRNQSRRWCDMKDCGNRAKARRFYRQKQQAHS